MSETQDQTVTERALVRRINRKLAPYERVSKARPREAAKSDAPDLLTTNEAADMLRLSPRTLWNWSSEGRGLLRPVKVGSRLLWRRSDVERVLRGGVSKDGD